MLLGYIVGFSLLGSAGSLIGGGLILVFPHVVERFRKPFLAFALGTLLAVTFLDVMPRAVTAGPVEPVFTVMLGAFLAFFLLEKFLHGHHVHGVAEGEPVLTLGRSAGPAILLGDTLHNFVDGVLIATAFLVSVPLGIATAIAVLAHELPQELGDMVILINSGFKPWQAYVFNALSGLASLVGALVAYAAKAVIMPYIPYMLAIAAASFLYIAASNLDPVVQHEPSRRKTLIQTSCLLGGVVALGALHHLLHHMTG